MIKRIELRVKRVEDYYIKFFKEYELMEHEDENKKFETPKMYQGYTKESDTEEKKNRRIYKSDLEVIKEKEDLTSLVKLEDNKDVLMYYCSVKDPSEDFIYNLKLEMTDTITKKIEEIQKILHSLNT